MNDSSSSRTADEVAQIQKESGVVGRETELRRALAAIRADRHLLIEGPVGVGKTVLALAVARHLKRPFFRVDGDERYTEQKLSGWFDPPLALQKGYTREAFIPGPLAVAMESGGLLFINELNRMAEGVQNVLLPAMDEGRIDVPKIGTIHARKGFAVIATQNPREFVATSALSEALADRFELLTLNYQPEEEEIRIVEVGTHVHNGTLVEAVVRVARRTRTHPAIRRGASVRGAMSMAALAAQLDTDLRSAVRESALMALPTRIELREDARKGAREVIEEILLELQGLEGELDSARKEKPPAKVEAPLQPKGPVPAGAERRGLMIELDPGEALEQLREYLDFDADDADETGWMIARQYSHLKFRIKDRALLEAAKRIAVRAVINRTLALLGAAPMPKRLRRGGYAGFGVGELDLESTFEESLAKASPELEDLVIEMKEPVQIACALMIDSSLSMTGEKLALATASMAVLAYKLKSIDFALITFESDAHLLKRTSQKVRLEHLIGQLLDTQAVGYTNIDAALRLGSAELSRARAKVRLGIMITDGNYTIGEDPRAAAAAYPKLIVLMIQSHDSRPEICEAMVAAGHGTLQCVSSVDEIPRSLYRVLRGIRPSAAPPGARG